MVYLIILVLHSDVDLFCARMHIATMLSKALLISVVLNSSVVHLICVRPTEVCTVQYKWNELLR